jgi:hypothetical protein
MHAPGGSPLIVVYTRNCHPVQVPNGSAVVAVDLPSRGTDTPPAGLAVVAATGERLAVFRQSEVAGYDLSRAGTDA